MTLITDILKNIQLPDVDLNDLIQSYLDGEYYRGPTIAVQEWRKDNYAKLREVSYPPVSDLNDAEVKLNSGVPELETEGQQEKDTYVQKCLQVKQRFPKE